MISRKWRNESIELCSSINSYNVVAQIAYCDSSQIKQKSFIQASFSYNLYKIRLWWWINTPYKWWISYPCLYSEMNGQKKLQLRTMFCTSASPFWWMHIMELKRIILGRNSMVHHWIIRIGVGNIQQGATMSFCTYNQLEVTTKTVSSIRVSSMPNSYFQ